MPGQLHTTVDLFDAAVLVGEGLYRHESILIPPNAVINDAINPDNNLPYIVIRRIQFDGVLSGQVTYNIVGKGGSEIGGYAVAMFDDEPPLINEKGRPMRYEFLSSQSTTAVVNIDYYSLQVAYVENDILPALQLAYRPGAR